MEILLLGIYSFFVWLIFIKFKWLPWNIAPQVIVVIIPIVGLTRLILLLNVVAPSSSDVRVYQVHDTDRVAGAGPRDRGAGRGGNRLVKKGDVLFRIDPRPTSSTVQHARSAARDTQGVAARAARSQLTGASGQGRRSRAPRSRRRRADREVDASWRSRASASRRTASSSATGAGNRFDLEQAETESPSCEGQLDAARSAEAQARAAEAQARQRAADPAEARRQGRAASTRRWRRSARSSRTRDGSSSETTTRSPCDCYVINLQLRPGRLRRRPAAQSRDDVRRGRRPGHRVLQPERAAPGAARRRGGVRARDATRASIIKGKVDSIIWAQGQGQMPARAARCRCPALADPCRPGRSR